MSTPDWLDRVVEATTPDGREVLLNEFDGTWSTIEGANSKCWSSEYVSDVRVIVDRDGRVAPPQITEEMVERAAEAIRQCSEDDGEVYDDDLARAALRAALEAQP